jgi:hypothetical protein
MTKITNHARGPRFFNVKGEGGQVGQLVLALARPARTWS